MTNRKNHNSLIFITTLGVYLGLVLVGGSAPQVFAHSALTRNFEISEEIEVKDDLDNNPDDETSSLSDSIKVYLEDVEYFLANLQKLRQSGEFDIDRDTFEVIQTTELPCIADNKIGSYTANSFVSKNVSVRPLLESFSKRLTDGYSLADCLPGQHFGSVESHASKFRVQLDRSEFFIDVAVKKRSPQTAKALLGDLGRSIRRFDPSGKDIVRQRILANTNFRSKNDQVFVITRLPRADLDPLLAQNAQ